MVFVQKNSQLYHNPMCQRCCTLVVQPECARAPCAWESACLGFLSKQCLSDDGANCTVTVSGRRWVLLSTLFETTMLLVTQLHSHWAREPHLSHLISASQSYQLAVTLTCCTLTTGGWWHLHWGERTRGNDWSGISGKISNTSNTWFPCVWCHSIRSVPDIIMSRSPLSSLHWHLQYICHKGQWDRGSSAYFINHQW